MASLLLHVVSLEKHQTNSVYEFNTPEKKHNITVLLTIPLEKCVPMVEVVCSCCLSYTSSCRASISLLTAAVGQGLQTVSSHFKDSIVENCAQIKHGWGGLHSLGSWYFPLSAFIKAIVWLTADHCGIQSAVVQNRCDLEDWWACKWNSQQNGLAILHTHLGRQLCQHTRDDEFPLLCVISSSHIRGENVQHVW